MKQISAIILTFFLATLKLYSQNIFESNWYNSNGKLQADTNYIINKEQYSKWIPIEHHFTKAFGQQFTFPSYLRGTSTYGNLVFSFETDTNGILYKSTIESINVKLDTNIKANLNLVCDSIVKSRLPFVLTKFYKLNTSLPFVPFTKYYVPLVFCMNLNSRNENCLTPNEKYWNIYTVYSYH